MPVPFITSRLPSTDDFEVIDPGENPTSFTNSQSGPANRRWALLDAANGANLPDNPYRLSVNVDNTAGSTTAWVVNGSAQNPSYTLGHLSIPAGQEVVFSRENMMMGTGACSVVLDAATGAACVVSEISAIV